MPCPQKVLLHGGGAGSEVPHSPSSGTTPAGIRRASVLGVGGSNGAWWVPWGRGQVPTAALSRCVSGCNIYQDQASDRVSWAPTVQAVVCGREAHLVNISNLGEGPGCSEHPPNTMASGQEWQEVGLGNVWAVRWRNRHAGGESRLQAREDSTEWWATSGHAGSICRPLGLES